MYICLCEFRCWVSRRVSWELQWSWWMRQQTLSMFSRLHWPYLCRKWVGLFSVIFCAHWIFTPSSVISTKTLCQICEVVWDSFITFITALSLSVFRSVFHSMLKTFTYSRKHSCHKLSVTLFNARLTSRTFHQSVLVVLVVLVATNVVLVLLVVLVVIRYSVP